MTSCASSRSDHVRRLVVALGIVQVALQLVIFVPLHWSRTDTHRDLAVYYAAAHEVADGRPLYPSMPAVPLLEWPHARYLYPPPFLGLIRPFTRLPYLAFARLWHGLLLIGFWGYAACLGRAAMGRWRVQSALIAGLAVGLLGGNAALSMGNVDLLLLGCLGLALVSPWPESWLTLTAAVKIHPIWAVLAVCYRRRAAAWRILSPGVVLLVVGAWACGWASYGDWVRVALPMLSRGTLQSQNVSLSLTAVRWTYALAGRPLPAMTWPLGVRLWFMGCSVGLPLLVLWLTRHRSERFQMACVALAGAISGPLTWPTYWLTALAPLAVWIGERRPPAAASMPSAA